MSVAGQTVRPGFVAEIDGVDISRPIDTADMDALWAASDEYAVLVFHGQHLTEAQQIAFTEHFGRGERYVFSPTAKR